jgi:16S rRNA (cytosine1402-N4)-methyltransferase
MGKEMAELLDEHIPVLSQTLLEQISLSPDAVLIDCTVGYGGHSSLFGKNLSSRGIVVGIDVDEDCLKRARETLSGLKCKVILVRENFSEIDEIMAANGIKGADFILADLGFCSGQMSNVERGLSFQKNMPLDMRLDDRLETSAADIINRMAEKDLANLIYKYSEERGSRRIARFIVHQRKAAPIATTEQLAMIVCRALGQPATGRRSKIHPATRTFQALRIAVNNELESIEKLLEAAPRLLNENGKIAIISFHSLEDKIVKEDFKRNQAGGVYKILTKKPLTATEDEIRENPRARSAKLRIAQKQNSDKEKREFRL